MPLEDKLTIRPASNADAPAIREIVYSVLAEYDLEPDPDVTDADLADIERDYFAAGGVFEVVEDGDGRMVGTVGLRPWNPRQVELRKMYLVPEVRGRGLGRRLLERMLARARELGFEEIWLETNSVLVEAVGLYTRYGFQPARREHLSPRCDQAYFLRLSALAPPPEPSMPAVPSPERPPPRKKPRPPARVLRRFGIRVILGVTVLLGAISSFLAFGTTSVLERAVAFALIVVWLAAVALGQVFLYRGRRPRLASVVAGAIAFGVLLLGSVIVASILSGDGPRDMEWLLVLAIVPLYAAIFGAPLGYLAGGLLAGIFLMAEGPPEEEEPPPPLRFPHHRSRLIMSTQPSITTERLMLRPFQAFDGPEVRRLAGEREIASTTLHIPHPYPEGAAEDWIATHQELFDQGKAVVFAIMLQSEARLIGAIGLTVHPEHDNAELGYWIGKPYWNQGYATEAGAAVVRYGFEVLGLARIYAHHFARNPASGRVMQKLGMKHEGRLRGHVKKWENYEDQELYGILRDEFAELAGTPDEEREADADDA